VPDGGVSLKQTPMKNTDTVFYQDADAGLKAIAPS